MSVEILSERKTKVGGVTVVFTVGRIVPSQKAKQMTNNSHATYYEALADYKASKGLCPEKRPEKRPDGVPTRCDMQWMSDPELAIMSAVDAIERFGGSPALTDAVNLLAKAKERVADHVEGKP